MSLAAAAMTLAVVSGVAGVETLNVPGGVARELLAGTTAGRQALVGSCWFGPLPSLAGVCAAWLGGSPVAAPLAVAAWVGWALALFRIGRLLPAAGVGRLCAQAAAACAIGVCDGALDPAVSFPVWLGIMAAGACADWSLRRSLGALSNFGFALGALALCGMSLAGWSLAAALLLGAVTRLSSDVRQRLPAVLLLGWLPLVYALSVWALLDWLLLGHPFYFVRPLMASGVLAWRGGIGHLSAVTVTALAAAAVAGVVGAWRRRADAGVLVLLSIAAWLWGATLTAAGVDWSAVASEPLCAALAVLALLRTCCGPADAGRHWNPAGSESAPARPVARARIVPASAVAGVALVTLALAARTDAGQGRRQARLAAVRRDQTGEAARCREVEAYVRSRTPYGRVFVCGYEGLGLLRSQSRIRLLPSMDLHVAALRRQYFGQTLFILVHKPEGRAATDSVHVRYPGGYRYGFERAIFARDFGPWRLFEVVGAPTGEQLRAWRQPPAP